MGKVEEGREGGRYREGNGWKMKYVVLFVESERDNEGNTRYLGSEGGLSGYLVGGWGHRGEGRIKGRKGGSMGGRGVLWGEGRGYGWKGGEMGGVAGGWRAGRGYGWKGGTKTGRAPSS